MGRTVEGGPADVPPGAPHPRPDPRDQRQGPRDERAHRRGLRAGARPASPPGAGSTTPTCVFTTDHGELQGDYGFLYKGPFHIDALMRLPLVWRPAPSAGVAPGRGRRPGRPGRPGRRRSAPSPASSPPDWMQGAALPGRRRRARPRAGAVRVGQPVPRLRHAPALDRTATAGCAPSTSPRPPAGPTASRRCSATACCEPRPGRVRARLRRAGRRRRSPPASSTTWPTTPTSGRTAGTTPPAGRGATTSSTTCTPACPTEVRHLDVAAPGLPRTRRGSHGRPAHPRRPLRRPARLPVRAPLRGGRPRRRRRRPAAGPLPRRGPGRRRGRAAPARRAVVVLPVPHDDPGAGRRRACGASPPTWSASAAPTSRPSRDDYTYARHVEWMREALLRRRSASPDVTLVGQDWGGLIGLRLVGEHPDRFARVVAANTGLPTGDRHAERGVPGLAAVLPGDAGRSRRRHRRTAAAPPTWPPRSSPPTTPRSPTTRYKAGRPDVPHAGADLARRPGAPSQPGGVGGAGHVRPAVPHRLLRPRPDHRRRRRASSSARSPARRASPTRRSRAAATSSRRTRAPSWPGWSPTSSPPRPDRLGPRLRTVVGMPDVLLSRDDHVATITLNRPDRLNAISGPMLAELARMLVPVRRRPRRAGRSCSPAPAAGSAPGSTCRTSRRAPVGAAAERARRVPARRHAAVRAAAHGHPRPLRAQRTRRRLRHGPRPRLRPGRGLGHRHVPPADRAASSPRAAGPGSSPGSSAGTRRARSRSSAASSTPPRWTASASSTSWCPRDEFEGHGGRVGEGAGRPGARSPWPPPSGPCASASTPRSTPTPTT